MIPWQVNLPLLPAYACRLCSPSNPELGQSSVHGRLTIIKHGGLLNCSGPSMLTISLHRALNALKDSLQSAALKVYLELMLRLRLDVSIPKAWSSSARSLPKTGRLRCQNSGGAATGDALLQAMPVSRTPGYLHLSNSRMWLSSRQLELVVLKAMLGCVLHEWA